MLQGLQVLKIQKNKLGTIETYYNIYIMYCYIIINSGGIVYLHFF
jgi:hypothetical protein